MRRTQLERVRWSDWLGNEESSITTRYGWCFVCKELFKLAASRNVTTWHTPRYLGDSHFSLCLVLSLCQLRFILTWLPCCFVSTNTHAPVNDLADNGSCTLFNTDPQKRNKPEKDVDFNYLVSPLVVRFTTTYCFSGLKGNGWMKKKKSYCIFHSLFFLFPTAALMVNGLLFAGHECLMMEEVSLFFVVKGRHCSVQTWPVVNDRLVRFHASEKRVVLVSPPPPSKMFAARRRTGKRRKRGDVRTARRSSASKPLFCVCSPATIPAR